MTKISVTFGFLAVVLGVASLASLSVADDDSHEFFRGGWDDSHESDERFGGFRGGFHQPRRPAPRVNFAPAVTHTRSFNNNNQNRWRSSVGGNTWSRRQRFDSNSIESDERWGGNRRSWARPATTTRNWATTNSWNTNRRTQKNNNNVWNQRGTSTKWNNNNNRWNSNRNNNNNVWNRQSTGRPLSATNNVLWATNSVHQQTNRRNNKWNSNTQNKWNSNTQNKWNSNTQNKWNKWNSGRNSGQWNPKWFN